MNVLDLAMGLLLLPVVVADTVMNQKVEFEPEIKTICNRDFVLYTADSPERWQQGFKYKKVSENEAMFFVFPSESFKIFWMKDTVSALDIVYLDKNMKITRIIKGAKPCKFLCKPYIGRAKYVLEFKAGVSKSLGLEKGQRLKL